MNLDNLKLQGITHIINCSPKNCQNLFPEDFEYLTLNMLDEPSFDIQKILIWTI